MRERAALHEGKTTSEAALRRCVQHILALVVGLTVALPASAQVNMTPIQYQWFQTGNNSTLSSFEATMDVASWRGGGSVHASRVPVAPLDSDVVIEAFDDEGGSQWIYTFTAPGIQTLGEIKTTLDGGVVFLGSSNGQIVLLKLTASGSLSWQKTVSAGAGLGVAELLSGDGFILCGQTSVGEAFVARTDAVGNTVWSGLYGGSVFDSRAAVDIDTVPGGGFILLTAGGGVAVVKKLEAGGATSWSTNLVAQYANNTYPQEIKPTSDGGYITTGYGYDASFQAYGAFLAKHTAGGSEEWNRTYYSSGWGTVCCANQTYAYDVVETGDGHFLVVGAADTGLISNVTGRGRLVFKVNENGERNEPSYGIVSVENTWQSVESEGEDHYTELRGLVKHDGCQEGYIAVGFDEAPGSDDLNTLASMFYLTDYNGGDYYDHLNITLSTPTTWISDKAVAGTLTIQSGASLNIANATLEMGICGKIIVEVGARLETDNGRITSLQSFDESMWQGIEVNGNRFADQVNPANQGVVQLRDSTVENATNAISTRRGDQTWSATGGIVQAERTLFLNNRRSMEFLSYQNIHPTLGLEISNRSYVSECTFSNTDPMRDPDFNGQGVMAHVTMWQTRGIPFRGSAFENTGGFGAGARGRGIFSIDAMYTVGRKCTSLPPLGSVCPGINSRFAGLTYGIWARSAGGLATVRTGLTDFENNEIGLLYHGNSVSTVTRSSFALSADGPGFSYGAAALWTSGFHWEENSFDDSGGGTSLPIGALALDTGAAGGSIYRNDFQNLHLGDWMLQDNSALRIDCNTYDNMGSDWWVASGILGPQGGCSATLPPAHNEFDAICTSGSDMHLGHYPAPGSSLLYLGEFAYMPDPACVTLPEISLATCFAGLQTNACHSTLSDKDQRQRDLRKQMRAIERAERDAERSIARRQEREGAADHDFASERQAVQQELERQRDRLLGRFLQAVNSEERKRPLQRLSHLLDKFLTEQGEWGLQRLVELYARSNPKRALVDLGELKLLVNWADPVNGATERGDSFIRFYDVILRNQEPDTFGLASLSPKDRDTLKLLATEDSTVGARARTALGFVVAGSEEGWVAGASAGSDKVGEAAGLMWLERFVPAAIAAEKAD